MPTRDWQFHVWKSTATSLSTALVDFTITNAELAGAPTITGSRIRPLDARTEARPWTVEVLDASSFFTRQIGDSAGRLDLLNRFVQARLSIDGSTYAPVAGGRLIDAVNADDIALWRMTVQDEWLAGANTMLFTTNTSYLYPPRPYRGYKGAAAGRTSLTHVTRINSASPLSKRYWYVNMNGGAAVGGLTDEGAAFIRGDLTSLFGELTTRGNFKYLRFRSGGVDYKVVGFDTIRVVPYKPNPQNFLFNEDELSDHQRKGKPLNFWIAASSTAFGGSGSAVLGIESDPALHAMTAPASLATPLHIWPGWSSGNPWGTVHPMQVLKDVLDGVYSSSSEATPYYSTESFTGTKDIRKLPGVGVAFRITQPQPLRSWVTDNLLAPHGVAAFGDARGKVAFKSILLPDPQLGYSTASLYSFTSTNLREPHPDWRTTRREQVTQVELQFERISLSVAPGSIDIGQGRATYTPEGFALGGDGISAKTDSVRFNHDRVNRYGVYPQTYQFNGYGTYGDYNPYDIFPEWLTSLQHYQGDFVQKLFHRYGDGPIQGTLHTLPGASTIAPGDFARLALASFPNPSSGGYRGGTRLVQVLSKDITPEGYSYEYLDAGGAATPLTSPTVTLSTSTSDPKHTLRATVSAGVPSGGVVSLYMAESATTSPPSSTSAAWHPVFTTVATNYGQVTATGTYNLPRQKSGQRFFVKGQASKANSVRSAMSTPVTKVTGSITSPSVLTMTSVKAHTAGLTWTLGDSQYPTDIHVDTSTAGTPTTGNLIYRMGPGSNRANLADLTAGQKYRSWVRHTDPFGGHSGFDSTTFTMTSTATTSNVRKAPTLGGLYIVFGST